LEKIFIFIDLSNKSKKSIGLYTPSYTVAKSGSKLIIESNLNNQNYGGCGDNIEFCLTPTLARFKEDQETQRRRMEEERRRREEEERERQRKEDERRQKEERERREHEEYIRKKTEKCPRAFCRGGYAECRSCTSYGSTIKNYKCSHCHGSGGGPCEGCHGSGLRYPDMR